MGMFWKNTSMPTGQLVGGKEGDGGGLHGRLNAGAPVNNFAGAAARKQNGFLEGFFFFSFFTRVPVLPFRPRQSLRQGGDVV